MVSKINTFLIGDQGFANETERKQSILLGQLALISALICFIYLVADPINGIYSFLQWYIYGLIISIGVVFLNRTGYYMVAASVLIGTTIIILFIIGFIAHPDRGVNFYFISVSVTSLVFFYNRNISYAIGFILIGVIASITAYYVESPVHELVLASGAAADARYTMNFVLGTFCAVVVVFFLIKQNDATESSMRSANNKLKELSQDLEISKTRFERAVSGTKAGIYEWSIITNEIYVSSRWRELLGYGEDIHIDMPFYMGLIHPDDAERSSNAIGKLLQVSKNSHYQNEWRLKTASGDYRWFLDNGIIEIAKAKPAFAVGSLIDIHDKKIAESEIINKNIELQKANDELDRFVYSASHDLRAPLSTLLGLIELVKMSKSPKEYEKYFKMMISRINEMEGFINEVTDYSRNTRLDVYNKDVDLVDLVKNICESFSTTAKQDKIKLEYNIDATLAIKTDEARLKVILNNLIANAIKYHAPAKKKKFVRISASVNSGNCNIVIEDNGIGIADEYQNNIFDMFYRAADDSSGSGLGLYIVKETLEKLNGQVSFTSKVREGSSFIVTLPTKS